MRAAIKQARTLGESILRRRVGTPEVMAQQMVHLLEMMDRPDVVIQVVRDTGEYFRGCRGNLRSRPVGRFQIRW
jgi:hypothetical protein